MNPKSPERITLQLLRAAKTGTLHKVDPTLLTYENLNSVVDSTTRKSASPLEVAAKYGHLDQVPVAVLDVLSRHRLGRLRFVHEQSKGQIGDGVPF